MFLFLGAWGSGREPRMRYQIPLRCLKSKVKAVLDGGELSVNPNPWQLLESRTECGSTGLCFNY